MRLGESSQHNQVRHALAHEIQRTRIFHAALLRESLREVAISFVQNDEYPLRNFFQEAPKLFREEHCASGVIGIGDKNYPGVMVNRRQDRIQIKAIIVQRHGDVSAAANFHDRGINNESAFAANGIKARRKQGAGDDIQKLRRAGGDQHLLRIYLVALGQLAPQLAIFVVRIKIRLRCRFLHGVKRARRWSKRILVGSHFDAAHAALALGAVDGLAGNIFRHFANVRRHQRIQFLHAPFVSQRWKNNFLQCHCEHCVS